MEQPQQREQQREETTRCYWHSDVETGLSCSRCDKHICTECMVQAPVGIRCKECGKATRMPTYDVRPTHYVPRQPVRELPPPPPPGPHHGVTG